MKKIIKKRSPLIDENMIKKVKELRDMDLSYRDIAKELKKDLHSVWRWSRKYN